MRSISVGQKDASIKRSTVGAALSDYGNGHPFFWVITQHSLRGISVASGRLLSFWFETLNFASDKLFYLFRFSELFYIISVQRTELHSYPALTLINCPGNPTVEGNSTVGGYELIYAQNFPVQFFIGSGTGKIIECFFGHADDEVLYNLRPFFGSLFGMLDAAFPLKYSPAINTVLR